MLMIKNIEIADIPEREAYVYRKEFLGTYEPGKFVKIAPVVERELVKGENFYYTVQLEHFKEEDKKYVRENYVIGWAETVEKALNLPLNCIYNLKKENENFRAINCKLSKESTKRLFTLQKYQEMSFWKRLKFLFTGEV